MSSINKFEQASDSELKVIKKGLSKISLKSISYLEQNRYVIFISSGKSKYRFNSDNVFLVSKELLDLLLVIPKDVLNRGKSGGIYFGYLERNKFFISIEGAEFLYLSNCFSEDNFVYLTEDGEKSALYGNQILKKMIFKVPESLKERSFLLVFNQLKELITIAFSRVNYSQINDMNPDSLIALNLVDKGYYLREKQ